MVLKVLASSYSHQIKLVKRRWCEVSHLGIVQASCCYLEAEAAVLSLKNMSEDVVMPFQVAPLPTDAETGVRTAPKTPDQLQALVKHALVAGMQRGLECNRSWAVVNGAVHAWNTFLPVIRAGRCALSSMLTLGGILASMLCPKGHQVIVFFAGISRCRVLSQTCYKSC